MSSPGVDSRPPTDGWSSPEPPVPVPRPMLLQAWRDCSFLHWACDPDDLRPHLPRGFEVDAHDGRAWVSLISFRIARMRPGALPPVPGLRSALESHLRTYVRGPDGRRGIWMLSIDIDPLAAALAGRAFALPYWWADIDAARRDGGVGYRVRRRLVGTARLDADLALGDEVDPTELDERDHFLTARWVLYGGLRPIHTAILTEHPRWRFRRVTVQRVQQDVTAAAGLPLGGPPDAVHFSDGVDARLSWPRPLGA